jgi:hypothetical protein
MEFPSLSDLLTMNGFLLGLTGAAGIVASATIALIGEVSLLWHTDVVHTSSSRLNCGARDV